MKKYGIVAVVFILCAVSAEAQIKAHGLGVNLPVIGRLIGGGNTLFRTSVDVSNNTASPTQVDFYFDGVDVSNQAPIVIDGVITNNGLFGPGGGTLRGYSNAHFADFIESLVLAGMLPAAIRDHGVLGSVLLVFNAYTEGGQGSASARFYNDLAGGTVGVSLNGHEVTANEPRALVATVRDTRGKPGPQLYTNMFINNIGLTPNGEGTANTISVQLTARSNSTGQPIGVPITIENIGPGQTASVNQVLTALQVPASSEDTILVFVRATSGNAAIGGVISIVDAVTRDGSIVEMSRSN